VDVMQFGKHKGVAMDLIPLSYLRWCAENLRKCPLVIQELDRRGELGGVSGKAVDKYKAIKANPLTYKGTFVGRDYQRLRAEFDRADGDADACPFDTKDHKYMGPTIGWNGGTPIVTPSEFPKEMI
jgi:hypothetical protein